MTNEKVFCSPESVIRVNKVSREAHIAQEKALEGSFGEKATSGGEVEIRGTKCRRLSSRGEGKGGEVGGEETK